MLEFAFVELRQYLCSCGQSGEVVGVTELCNKKGGGPFTRCDEQIAQAYSVYCSMSVIHVSQFVAVSLIGGTAAASPLPTGIGDPALCGSQPVVTPVSLCRFRD